MTINSIHRVIPTIPEIRVFSLLNRKKDVDVELIITADLDDGSRSIRACIRKGKKLEGLALKDNSAHDAVAFVALLWNACKSDENYTISNASRIGILTARLFPDFACTRQVFDAVEDKLGITGEEIIAFVMAVKSVPHKRRFAFSDENDPSFSECRPAVTGSLVIH